MPVARTAPFDADAVQLAGWARALGHPARLAILRALAERGTCICGDVVEILPLAQSTVSQHLKALVEAGLITVEADGPRSCYCLAPEAVAALREQMSAFLDDLAGACEPGDCAC